MFRKLQRQLRTLDVFTRQQTDALVQNTDRIVF